MPPSGISEPFHIIFFYIEAFCLFSAQKGSFEPGSMAFLEPFLSIEAFFLKERFARGQDA